MALQGFMVLMLDAFFWFTTLAPYTVACPVLCTLYWVAFPNAERGATATVANAVLKSSNREASSAAHAAGGCAIPPRQMRERLAHASMIATARVQPADARCTFTGKHTTSNPSAGNCSRLCSFSRCE